MILDTRKAGVFLYDTDFEYFRRATTGKEVRVLKAIIKRTIIEGDKLGKKRVSGTRDVICKTNDPILLIYETVNKMIGNEELKRLNWRVSQEFKNGYGDINAQVKEADREFEVWLKENAKKYDL